MSKGILIFEKIPENCSECPGCQHDGYYSPMKCHLGSKFNDNFLNGANLLVRPNWCPLKPVPEKHNELSIEEYEFGKLGLAFTQGYNACLKEILGE